MILLLIFLPAFGQACLALDFSGYLDNKAQLADDETISGMNKLKLDAKVNSDTYYLLVTLTGINNFGVFAGDENAIQLSRAYLDLYQKWGKITIGQQNLAWGNGYLFNLADLFNPINVLDPKGEKEGLAAADVKWNLTDTARLEAAVLPGSKVSESDYGLRGQFTVGNFEITANALRKTFVNTMARHAYVLEGKGELGENAPGIWVQGGYFRDEPPAGEASEYFNWVYGSDYTVAIGNGLYLLGEFKQNGQPGADNQLYLLTRYSVNANTTWSLAALRDIRNQADMLSLNVKYFLNDNIEFNGTYNYYPIGSLKAGMAFDNSSEIIFEIKTNF